MTEQLHLVDVPATGRSTRTEFVLNAIQAAGDTGLYPEEVGALLHAYDRRHSSTERCEHCARDSIRVLRDLSRRRLITRRHGNRAVAAASASGESKPPAMTDEIPY